MPHAHPTYRLPFATALAALACVSAAPLTGCGRSLMTGELADKTAITPDDFFVNADGPDTPTPPSQQVASADSSAIAAPGSTGDDTDADPAQAGDDPRTDNDSAAISINAMVGHINGEAVYADQIFDVNVVAQLRAFGRRYDGEQFLSMAYPVIEDRLRGVIIDKLILGEAELNLADRQRLAIDRRVQMEREELLRYHGQGSIAKARAEFRKEKGVELDDHLADFRQELSIGIYIRATVLPKISVSQINIENYYDDNLNKYHQPARRTFRMMKVADNDTAQAVKARLDRGEPFKQIASDPDINLYNAGGEGFFNGGEPYPGDFGIGPVNDELIKLKDGEHAGPIIAGKHQYFVQLVKFEPGVEIPLAEAQLEIEKTLRALEFERHTRRFRADLYERGSYSDPARMGRKLLEIAHARYDE